MSAVTNRFQCPLCMDEMKEPTLTPCHHRFCHQCLIKWLRQRQTCPSCNRSVEESEIVKDHQFESLVDTVKKVTEKAVADYFANLGLDQVKESLMADTGSGYKEEANEAGSTGLPTDTVVTDEPGVTETHKTFVDVTSSADARVGKGEHGVTGTNKSSVDVTSSADARVGKGEHGVTGTNKSLVDVTYSDDARVGKGEHGVTGTNTSSVDVTSLADARVGKGEHGVTGTNTSSVDVTSLADARVGKGGYGEGAQKSELPSIETADVTPTGKLSSLEKGIEYVSEAVKEDENQNYGKAISLYTVGADYFFDAMKYEAPSEKSKEAIRRKLEMYLDRAEIIGEYLERKHKLGESSGSTSEDSEDDEGNYSKELFKWSSTLPGVTFMNGTNVKLEEVAGLEVAKAVLKEAIVIPAKFPHLFTGRRKPWKTIVLFGPPGTGKSYLAKAMATEAEISMFFCVSFDDILSPTQYVKTIPENLLRKVINKVRENTPSILYFNDIDLLCSTYSGEGLEGLEARRKQLRTEFLEEIWGQPNEFMVLAGTSSPWQLDFAMMRIFEKRVFVPLPDSQAREQMFELPLKNVPHSISAEDLRTLSEMTEGFSAKDIAEIVTKAMMEPVRIVETATHFKWVQCEGSGSKETTEDLMTPCSEDELGAIKMDFTKVPGDKLLVPVVEMADMVASRWKHKSTVNTTLLTKYEEFAERHICS